MVRNMFTRLLLISSFIIQANLATTVLAQTTPAIYKVRLTGGGNAFFTGAANQWGRAEVSSTNEVSLYQSTLVVNMITGLGKWYEHTVVTSRACPVSQKGWNDSANCIEAAANVVGTANIIQLPKDANPKDYYFDLQWEESGGLHRARMDIRNAD